MMWLSVSKTHSKRDSIFYLHLWEPWSALCTSPSKRATATTQAKCRLCIRCRLELQLLRFGWRRLNTFVEAFCQKDAAFLLTIGSFLLAVELSYLQLRILVFSYNWKFFAYSFSFLLTGEAFLLTVGKHV